MTGLKIVSDRLDDNALRFAVVLPPRRNGEVNFGAAEAINHALLTINPDAYDPPPVEHIALADGVQAVLVPHDRQAELARDLLAGRVELDDIGRYPIPGCATGACSED